MEPSLRSSSYRAVECKLKRTDPSLHETIQRFVESLSNDVRVSQYADINYAVKKFETDKWFWLKPTGISGYLVFLPKTPVVWIDEQFKKSYKIPLRVSSDIYEKNTVMIASLNVSEGLLRLEDIWLHSGKTLRSNSFTQRWNTLLDFYTIQYKEDLVLQQGIRVETAIYESLYSVHLWEKTPQMMIAQGDLYGRRLRVQLTERVDTNKPHHKGLGYVEATPSGVSPAPAPAPVTPKKPIVILKRPAFVVENDDSSARAVPHPEYPDTYNIFINGVKKGYAAVQDIQLSRRLKKAAEGLSVDNKSKGLCVKVEWNSEFSSYEIQDLISN